MVYKRAEVDVIILRCIRHHYVRVYVHSPAQSMFWDKEHSHLSANLRKILWCANLRKILWCANLRKILWRKIQMVCSIGYIFPESLGWESSFRY